MKIAFFAIFAQLKPTRYVNDMRIIITLLLFCYTQVVRSQPAITYDDQSGLSHWIVSGVVQDRMGFVWMSTWNGLNRFDGYEFRQVKAVPGNGVDIPSEVIRSIALDEEGNILCKTDVGCFMLDTKTYQFKELPKSFHKDIPKNTTMKDLQGNIWKTERYGIAKTIHPHHPATMVDGTADIQARAFLKDRHNRWWLATKEDECIRVYSSDNVLKGYLGADGWLHSNKTPFGHRAYCIVETAAGDIWIGCKPGALLRLREQDDGSYQIVEFQHHGLTCNVVYHIAEDRQGRLWVGTFGGGIHCIPNPNDVAPSCIHFGGKEKVRRLLVTDRGNVMAATTDGLLVGHIDQTDIGKTTFKQIKREGKRAGSLAGNATMDIVNDHQGHIFIATENYGIDMTTENSLYDEVPQFTHFSKATSSLTSDACLSIAVKDIGHLLIVCTDRVMEWIPDSDECTTYSTKFWNTTCHFSEERPLMLPDGSWIFGQEKGAYIATQHSLNTRGYKPPLVFTELAINGKPLQMDIAAKDTLVIDTDERSFVLSFAALDYTDNSDICYRSRTNDGTWVNSGNKHSLTYYDIRPGTYMLEVQSTDHYGRWVNNTRKLTIIVKPYWYETLWAKLLGMFLLVVVIAACIYTYFYIRELNRQRRELLKKYIDLLAITDDNKNTQEQEPAPLPLNIPNADRKFLDKVKQYIDENIGNADANIDDMAAFSAVSRSTLNRKLRSLLGITATQLLIDARMEKARIMLTTEYEQAERPSVTEITYQCGYTDPRYFSRCFKQKYGKTPTEYAGR